VSAVKGYTTKAGKVVGAYQRIAESLGFHKPAAAPPPAKVTGAKQVVHHPRVDDKGKPVEIDSPSAPTPPENWADKSKIATVVPDGAAPKALNGVAMEPWKAPTTKEGWANVDGQFDIEEPPFHLPMGKKAGAGVVIMEPDGRAWLCHPTNQFGGYKATFPKGTAEEGLSLQANAIKEAFEETGLKVEIICHLGDWERTTSKARYYLARRTGGSPAAAGWESQAVSLVPVKQLYGQLNGAADYPVAEAIGAGTPPPPPPVQKPAGGKFQAPQFGYKPQKSWDFGQKFDDDDLEGYWDK
jgi:ADP-ribose pyrophosphatase YjhB (NUDIX family)